jgi:hypothetical protein
MGVYGVPGSADTVSNDILEAWNAEIDRQFTQLFQSLPEARGHLLTDPRKIQNGTPTDIVHWPCDPAEPRFCIDRSWAEKLSDWGVRGRHLFHNEYCEYTIVRQVDAQGRVRPKRFVATTELAEYWLTLATQDPDLLQSVARDALGWTPTFADLYGHEGANPHGLSPTQRRVLFALHTAGNGNDPALVQAGVKAEPTGDLNTKNVLFMSHSINGLDDLIYIVMFGARPYAVGTGATRRRANLHEIFRAGDVTHLACRNADPAAAQGAYDQAIKEINGDTARGSQVAFADPLGMYIGPFSEGDFTYQGNPIPKEWIVKRRGRQGTEQRLEFGPPDDHPAFLDDIVVSEGASEAPLTSGYQIARRFEVGPHLILGEDRAVDEPLDCSRASVCERTVKPAQRAYEQEHAFVQPRGGE